MNIIDYILLRKDYCRDEYVLVNEHYRFKNGKWELIEAYMRRKWGTRP